MLPRAMFEVAWCVRESGHEVDLIDCNLEAFNTPETAKRAVEMAITKQLKTLSEFGRSYAAIFVSWPTVAQGNIVRHVVQTVREQTSSLIVVGGGAVRLVQRDAYTQIAADIFYTGNGFEIARILTAADIGAAGDIPGVVGRHHQRHEQPRSDLIDGYSASEFYTIGNTFNFRAYVQRYTTLGLRPIGLLEMMRGCPHRCSYCAVRGELISVKYRDPQTVADEALFMLSAGITDYYVIDPTFGLHQKKTAKLLSLFKALRNQHPDFRWWGITRCDRITIEYARMLRAAGAHTMSIGVETMDQQRLDAVRKDTVAGSSERALTALRQAGIKARVLLMHFPGSHDTQTIRFLNNSFVGEEIVVQSSLMRPLYRATAHPRRIDFRRWDQETDGRAAGLDSDASLLGWLIANIAFASTSVNGRKGDEGLRNRLEYVDLDLWFRAADVALDRSTPMECVAIGLLKVGYRCDEAEARLSDLCGCPISSARQTLQAVAQSLRAGRYPPRSEPSDWLGIVAAADTGRWYYYPRPAYSYAQVSFNIKVGECLEDLDFLILQEQTFFDLPNTEDRHHVQ